MKRFLVTLAFCLSFATFAAAQNVQLINDLGIHEDELADVQERIAEKVDDFQRWIQDLAGRGNVSHNTKMEIYDRTLKLFIGEGKSYTTQVPNPYGGYTDQVHQAVTMSIINSKYNKIRTKQPMTTYLSNLIKRSENPNYRYKQVVIEAADAVRVDNFRRVGDGRYMATAHILQHFMGYGKDGMRVQYEDYTAKTITIYINRLEIATPEGMNYIWQILLGDVDCDDIW
ncbi:MAG: hypothetical protein IJK78_05775 [Bacteroidales bacterium]|nr:hypothetical protein [Bacteroidales bacterium]